MNMILDLSKEDRNISVGRTYIAFVLDRSGSMSQIKTQTIEGFNKQINAIKREAVGETFVSLVTFGSDVTPIFFNKPLDRLEYLNEHNYQPNGWTTLYDAIGYTINRLSNEAEYTHNAAFWVIIVSDGEENRSTTYKISLPSLIREKQYTKKWTFSYIGSNQDLAYVSQNLSIPVGNMMDWASTPIGTQAVYTVHANSVGDYFGLRKRGLTSSSSLYGPGGITVTTTDNKDSTIVVNNETAAPDKV